MSVHFDGFGLHIDQFVRYASREGTRCSSFMAISPQLEIHPEQPEIFFAGTCTLLLFCLCRVRYTLSTNVWEIRSDEALSST